MFVNNFSFIGTGIGGNAEIDQTNLVMWYDPRNTGSYLESVSPPEFRNLANDYSSSYGAQLELTGSAAFDDTYDRSYGYLTFVRNDSFSKSQFNMVNIAAIDLSGGFTGFVFIKKPLSAQSLYPLRLFQGANTEHSMYFSGDRVRYATGGSELQTGAGAISENTWHFVVVRATSNGGNSRVVRVDTTNVISDTNSWTNSTNFNPTSAAAYGGYGLGGGQTDVGVDVGVMGVYNKYLTDDECDAIRNSYSGYYGVPYS